MKWVKLWVAVFSLIFVLSGCEEEAESVEVTENTSEESKPIKYREKIDEAKEIIETSSEGTLTVSEAHAEADKKIEQLKNNFLPAFDDSITSVVQKVNLNSDEYPEIIHLKNTGNQSQLRIIRYIADSEYYPKNQWVIIYSKIFENPFVQEPLMYFGNMKFSPNGIDYPVFGVVTGNNELLSFGIYGIGEKENAEIVIDRMSKSYPQGKLILDNSKEYKLTVTSYGNIVETITEKEIK
jgi:uncharacterized lipoprotein YehR (DUF1307 family)